MKKNVVRVKASTGTCVPNVIQGLLIVSLDISKQN